MAEVLLEENHRISDNLGVIIRSNPLELYIGLLPRIWHCMDIGKHGQDMRDVLMRHDATEVSDSLNYLLGTDEIGACIILGYI